MHRVRRTRFISLATAVYLVVGTAWISLVDPWLSGLGPSLRSPLLSAGLFALVTSAMFFMALWAVPAPAAGESSDTAAAVVNAFRPFATDHPPWPTYAVAAVVSLALLALQPYILVSHDEQPLRLILFTLPIMLSAMIGGAGPGLLATAVVAFGISNLAHPAHPTGPVGSEHAPLHWLLLLVDGVFISAVAQAMRRSLVQATADRLLLQTVIRSVPDALSVKDAQGRYLFVNPTVETMFGKPAEAIIGRSAETFMQAKEAAALSSEDRQGFASRAPWSQEHEVVTQQGTRQFVTTRGPILGSSQALVGVVSLSRDVTEQRRVKAELERHNAELERLVDERTAELVKARDQFAARERLIHAVADAVPGLVGYWGADLVCRFGNRAHHDWYGKTAEQMVGISARDCLGDAVFNAVEPHVQEVLRGRPRQFQAAVRHADGSQRHTLVWYIPDTDAGKVRGFTAVVTDVSDLKRAELQLVALNAQLAQRAAEAERTTSAKSAFLANMSHEIRTPMNAVLGLNHLLQRDATDPLQRDRLAKVDAAARHLLQVINDILDLSKIEAGKMTLDPTEFDLDDVLERAMAMVRQRAAESGLELILETDQLPCRLVGDPTRLLQALINLLANAVKFTPSGWIRLRSTWVGQAEGRSQLRFQVQDTGPGIPMAQQARLFDAFEQGDSGTARHHGGTGLGLALTQSFARMMGGECGVSSTVGSGSTFWFTARFERAEVDVAAPPDRRFQGLRALLVDGLPESGQAIGKQLRQFGMTVACRHDAAGALEALAQSASSGKAFDILVANGSLPGTDGLALLREVRQAMGESLPRTLLATTQDDLNWCEMAPYAGVGGVLLKPATATAWAATLTRLLDTTSAGQPDPAPETSEAQLRNRHAGQRILLAEDNPVNQEVAVELLRAAGLIVDTAGDGQLAVDMAQAQPYALVLMDMKMPNLDGLDATRTLRRLLGPALPILAMTANAFGEDQAACLDAGMNDHLAKPIDPERLYRALMRWLPAPDAA